MENKNLFIVYKTDMWNSYASRAMRGIYGTKEDAIEAILSNHCISEEEADNDEIRKQLTENMQTQCCHINYDIVEVETNTWSDW